MCNRPRNPHRNPNPRAPEDSGSNVKLESLSRSFSSASRKAVSSSPSIGYSPQNTIGLGSRYPASGSGAGWAASVTVSPERAWPTSLIPAMR